MCIDDAASIVTLRSPPRADDQMIFAMNELSPTAIS